MGYDHMSVEVQSEMVCSGKQCSGAAQHSAQGTRSKHEDDGCLVPWLRVLPDYFSNLPEGTIKECSTMERSFYSLDLLPIWTGLWQVIWSYSRAGTNWSSDQDHGEPT